MKLPERRVCALCGHDDDVTIMPAPDGNGWQYTCPPGPSHTDARVWTVTEPAAFVGRDGVTAELGLYDDLPSLIAPGEPWLEYGVVEYRYRRLHHDRYGEVIRRYGHRSVEPKPFTASALIAKALGQLAREGIFALRWGPATGYWSYNGTVSYWSVPPLPADDHTVTWQAFAEATPGLDASEWTLTTEEKQPERRRR